MSKINSFTAKRSWIIFVLLLIPATLFAQDPGDPCSDLDPITNNCVAVPLDTYVWILVVAALIFGTVHLHRQQKAFSKI